MIQRPSRADIVTSTRFLCGLLILVGLPCQWSSITLLAIVVLAWTSDLVDGWIARHDGTNSPFGVRLDQWVDASFHALTALGWILASPEQDTLLITAVWLHGLGAAMNPLAFPTVSIPFLAAKIIGGGCTFVVDVLLVSRTLSLLPTEVVFAVSLVAFILRLLVLLSRGLLARTECIHNRPDRWR